MRSYVRSLFLLLTCSLFMAYTLNAQSYDVTASGARGDGVTDNTAFIQRAIDSCSKTGGKVFFPSGVFLTGTLYLKSNVILNVSGGATVLGHTDLSKYPYLDAGIRFYGEDWARQALIFCKGQENVGIEGMGTIDGQGAQFPITTIVKPDRYKNRPYLLWFAGCKNVSVRGIQLRNSAFWMQHYLGCEYVLIDGIRIWNHSNKNNDMMDIDGSKFVTVSNVTGDSDDDGITIKSTSPLISENITITNCIISSHCNGLKFGTESTGGFRNVVVSNCVIKPSRQLTTIYGKPAGISGIALEVVDGGIMENIVIDNVVIDGPQVPLFMRLGNRARKYIPDAPVPDKGIVRNIKISNVVARGADETGCSFSGLEKSFIEDISLSNISIETSGSASVNNIDSVVPEKETDYPEATMFGKLPAYGIYIRYAKNIRLFNVIVHAKGLDNRPGIRIEKTNLFSLSGMDIQSTENKDAAIYITNSSNGIIHNSIKSFPFRHYVLKDKNSVNIINE